MKYILHLLAMIMFFIFSAHYGEHMAAKKTRKDPRLCHERPQKMFLEKKQPRPVQADSPTACRRKTKARKIRYVSTCSIIF
jgi:hypothetical protein